MASKTLRVVLNSAEYPFVYSQAVRTLLSNDDATTRMPGSYSGARINADYGVPQLLYAENVLPIPRGYQSISYYQQLVGPADVTYDQAITLRDEDENQFLFCPGAGANKVYTPATGVWTSVDSFSAAAGLVTRAYVAGRTFVCYERQRIIESNTAGTAFTTVGLTYPPGLTITDVRGIGSASNYLLFFTKLAIHWCSPLNILDFDDLDAGAGNQTPVDIKGQIVAVLSCAGGFIIYTTQNAIGATFTSNSNAPFVFKEIANSGGISSWERVATSSEDQGHYALTTYGMQYISLQGSKNIFPEVADFLSGGVLDTWSESTVSFEQTTTASVGVKLAFIAGRYLALSYSFGTSSFNGALVYDTTLERWGNLTRSHSDLFSWPSSTVSGAGNYEDLTQSYSYYTQDYGLLGLQVVVVPEPKAGIALLSPTGQVDIVDVSYFGNAGDSVLVFGHLQARHDRDITVHGLQFEGVRNTPIVRLLGSEQGYARDTVTTPVLVAGTVPNFKEYDSRVTAANFDVFLRGQFVLTGLLATVSLHGNR